MLTGDKLGKAIADAILKKGITQRELARQFGVKPPSVQDWIKRGTIDKGKLPALWEYFSDVVGPEHWGLPGLPSAGLVAREPTPLYSNWPFPLIQPSRYFKLPLAEQEVIEAIVLRRITEWEVKSQAKREAG
jgi:transcriptional regulator with XRE-family HTH domain